MSSRKFLILVSALSVIGAVFADELALSDEEILTLVKGKRLAATGPSSTTYRLTFKDDGTMSGQEGHAVDSGEWKVEGGKLCLKWNKWKYDGCGKLVKSGNEVRLAYPAQDDKIYLTFNNN